jgi:molecular chaperone GrpE
MTQLSPEVAAQQAKWQREQERLFKDLLGVLDALDQACYHWQDAAAESEQFDLAATEAQPQSEEPQLAQSSATGPSFWQRLWHFLNQPVNFSAAETATQASAEPDAVQPQTLPEAAHADESGTSITETSIAEIIASGRDGDELIRSMLLELLRKRKVTPLDLAGKPFDAKRMIAIGRQESDTLPDNHVVQEIVKAYQWGDRLLREAQVIVAVRPK